MDQGRGAPSSCWLTTGPGRKLEGTQTQQGGGGGVSWPGKALGGSLLKSKSIICNVFESFLKVKSNKNNSKSLMEIRVLSVEEI